MTEEQLCELARKIQNHPAPLSIREGSVNVCGLTTRSCRYFANDRGAIILPIYPTPEETLVRRARQVREQLLADLAAAGQTHGAFTSEDYRAAADLDGRATVGEVWPERLKAALHDGLRRLHLGHVDAALAVLERYAG